AALPDAAGLAAQLTATDDQTSNQPSATPPNLSPPGTSSTTNLPTPAAVNDGQLMSFRSAEVPAADESLERPGAQQPIAAPPGAAGGRDRRGPASRQPRPPCGPASHRAVARRRRISLTSHPRAPDPGTHPGTASHRRSPAVGAGRPPGSADDATRLAVG